MSFHNRDYPYAEYELEISRAGGHRVFSLGDNTCPYDSLLDGFMLLFKRGDLILPEYGALDLAQIPTRTPGMLPYVMQRIYRARLAGTVDWDRLHWMRDQMKRYLDPTRTQTTTDRDGMPRTESVLPMVSLYVTRLFEELGGMRGAFRRQHALACHTSCPSCGDREERNLVLHPVNVDMRAETLARHPTFPPIAADQGILTTALIEWRWNRTVHYYQADGRCCERSYVVGTGYPYLLVVNDMDLPIPSVDGQPKLKLVETVDTGIRYRLVVVGYHGLVDGVCEHFTIDVLHLDEDPGANGWFHVDDMRSNSTYHGDNQYNPNPFLARQESRKAVFAIYQRF